MSTSSRQEQRGNAMSVAELMIKYYKEACYITGIQSAAVYALNPELPTKIIALIAVGWTFTIAAIVLTTVFCLTRPRCCRSRCCRENCSECSCSMRQRWKSKFWYFICCCCVCPGWYTRNCNPGSCSCSCKYCCCCDEDEEGGLRAGQQHDDGGLKELEKSEGGKPSKVIAERIDEEESASDVLKIESM